MSCLCCICGFAVDVSTALITHMRVVGASEGRMGGQASSRLDSRFISGQQPARAAGCRGEMMCMQTTLQCNCLDRTQAHAGRAGKERQGRPATPGRGVRTHVQSAAALSSKAGLSRPGSSVHTGRGAGVKFLSPGRAPKQSVSGGEVPGGSITVDPVSPSICVGA